MKKSVHKFITGLATTAAIISFPVLVHADNIGGKERIEVAFVLDTTGSMVDLIDGAKRKIWSIANTIVDIHPGAEINMALIGYRDIGDDYMLKTFDMSTDIQGLYGNLIRFKADGGGDTPEAVNEALNASMRDLDWSMGEDIQRIVFLVGDAPPHMDYENTPQYPEIIKYANKHDIVVNAIQAGGDRETRKVWKEIAQRGRGKYIPIPQDGGRITVIETPFDGDIIILQQRIDETVIPYGSDDEQTKVREKMSTKSEAPESVQVENSKFYSKRTSSKEVITGGGDLIGDIKNGVITLDKVEEKELPSDLQSLNSEEKQSYIEEKLAARAELEADMSRLIKKYDDYVADKIKSASEASDEIDSFDQAVQETLREQLN